MIETNCPWFTGFEARLTTLEDDLTVLIDYRKYQINQKLSERVRRHAEDSGNVTRDARQETLLPLIILPDGNISVAPYPSEENFQLPPFYVNVEQVLAAQDLLQATPPHDAVDDDNDNVESEDPVKSCTGDSKCEQKPNIVCVDPVNEVYQKCGSKCVLGCRYATSSVGITISKNDCDKNDCVEGCFCKTGLVRHQDKCILPQECPIRKCSKNEVYVSVFC